MALSEKELDRIFCMMGRKYKIKRLILKAIGIVESNLEERAYRFEPKYWERYMKGKPEWEGRDVAEVSASYGLMQIMYGTAVWLGFKGTGEELYNPVINIELGAKLLRKLLDKVKSESSALWSVEIALAKFNGGAWKNPDKFGKLRTQKYVDKVLDNWCKLKKKEKEDCGEDKD